MRVSECCELRVKDLDFGQGLVSFPREKGGKDRSTMLAESSAGRECGWFRVFPSHTLSTDPRAEVVRRHHIRDSVVQKAVKVAAVRAKLHEPTEERSVTDA